MMSDWWKLKGHMYFHPQSEDETYELIKDLIKDQLEEDTRRQLLIHLLESEAAERVESADGLAGHRWFRVGNVCTPQVVAEKNEVSVRLHDNRLNYDEVADFILCLAAALADKGRALVEQLEGEKE